jgi:hypothetical protein
MLNVVEKIARRRFMFHVWRMAAACLVRSAVSAICHVSLDSNFNTGSALSLSLSLFLAHSLSLFLSLSLWASFVMARKQKGVNDGIAINQPERRSHPHAAVAVAAAAVAATAAATGVEFTTVGSKKPWHTDQ